MKDTVRWTATKISRRLGLIEPLVYRNRSPLAPFSYKRLDGYLSSLNGVPDTTAEGWTVIPAGTYWGEWYTDFALHCQFTIPQDWDPSVPSALYLPLGESGDFCHPEALVFVDGEPCASCDRYHQDVLLPRSFQDGRSHSLDLIGWTGLGDIAKGLNTRLYMQPCYIVQIHQPLRELVALARVATGIVKNLSENEPSRWHVLNALDDAFKCLELLEPLGRDDFYESVPKAYKRLKEDIDRSGESLDIEVFASGHAHIDVAWLWPLEETRRKARHTFQTVAKLMEQFPEFIFTQSQPQLYEFVRQDAPQLFKTIQERVAEKKWEPIGGMWVEADCNLTGPESLARQFLLGRRFFQKYFGKNSDSRVLWLPDVFGYAWNLPQLIKQAGMDYFFTIKIGWNQYNRLPFDSFWWQGLDGTRVLTHFSPNPEGGTIDSGFGASPYNAAVGPEQAIGSWTNFQQKDLAGAGKSLPLLMAYGYGGWGWGSNQGDA